MAHHTHYYPTERDLRTLARSFESSENIHPVAAALGMSVRTANRYRAEYDRTGRLELHMRSNVRRKWDDDMQQYLLAIVQE